MPLIMFVSFSFNTYVNLPKKNVQKNGSTEKIEKTEEKLTEKTELR